MLEVFNLEKTTLSTCFETAGQIRIRQPYGTADRV